MKVKKGYGLAMTLFIAAAINFDLSAYAKFKQVENFESSTLKVEKVGKGLTEVKKGVLVTRDAYATFGELDWKDYEVSFKARTPKGENQVQIWSGFRASSRNDRYILGLRGGIQNDLYLARLGYMGTDDHLALRHLDFKLETGKWYDIKIQIVGNRIRVFLNNEKLPRIDVQDKYTEFSPNGKVVLGGSWITTEFDDLTINALDKDELSTEAVKEYAVSAENKIQKREKERSLYKPVQVASIANSRTKISLDGKWLFSPGYEVKNEDDALQVSGNDKDWHVLTVPNFWNPNREWLHGEKYNTASKGVSDNHYQEEIERCEGYTFDYKKTAIGYYRQWIELPENIKGKNLELNFDAVSKVGEVYINGRKLAHHIGMFGEFKINASEVLKPGKNLIAVKVTRDYVTNIKDADKVTDVAVTVPVTNKMLKDLAHGFYGDDPAGIWQPVSLIISDPVRIEDVFIKPSLTGATFEVTVKNYSNAQSDFSISTTILGEKLKDKLYDNLSLKSVILKAGEERILVYSISDIKPRLWTPATPELYDFAFVLTDSGKETDRKTITSGFRTFEAKGDFLYLNGKQYWLRGGNQTPMSLAPNDTLLANKFTKLLHDGNIMITRTHTAPYNELWMTASDKNGVGVSYEGQWPWLMIKSSMPDQKLIDLWKQEFFDLMMKYRNHPALLFWTVNNEMKFYDNDPDFERAKLKMAIISDVVKMMRKIDPTRPVCFDSNYTRDEKKFGKDFFNKIDDGDIDDHHWYVNWYHGTIFSEFKGEWQKSFKNPGRPLISQEFSTGYPSETGHPTRFYTYVHQNPGTLVGNYAYEYANPEYFLKAQSFITREGAEAIRRTNEKAAGILHFAALTWFKNVYQADKIAPHLTYLQIKKALQPVLVSAEIWGRHFYAGEKLPTRIYVVNDQDNGNALAQTELQWSLQTADGKVLTSGKDVIPPVEYYGRKFIEPTIVIPQNLPTSRVDGKLVLKLLENGKVISENDYEVLLASKQWLNVASLNKKKIVLVDLGKKIAPVFNYQGVKFIASATVNAAVNQKPDVLVLAGLDSLNTSKTAAEEIKAFVHKGGKVLVLNSDKFSASLYPDYIKGVLKENGEIISMEIPESGVFDGIEPLDIRYFNNNQRENPLVSKAFFQVNQGSGIESLATFSKVHGYLEGDIYQRKKKLEGEWKGFPIVKITDKGSITLSEVLVEKGKTDPIAGKLLTNMIQDLIK